MLFFSMSGRYPRVLSPPVVGCVCCMLCFAGTGIPMSEIAAADLTSTQSEKAIVKRIYTKILKKSQGAKSSESAGKTPLPADYQATIPSTQVAFDMIAIPSGTFTMGSPPDENDRNEDEGPAIKVQVSAFWIGKHEVTWDEYEPYMVTQVDRHKDGSRIDGDPEKLSLADAVSQPTPPYVDMSFGMGQSGFPAISMTQHAANKYCQWLSAQTGDFYRLPTEAEWEYACRAGTTTAYSFGDDPSRIDEYAWYYENSDEAYHKVGTKKPNPWGLHDMHGNVAEWTADAYKKDYLLQIGSQPTDPFLKPADLFPRSVRGGHWDDDPPQLRSAARRGSEASWKDQDPQLPKSVWFHTDAPWLGFRIVRPLKLPTEEEVYFFWNSAEGKTH